MRDPFYFALANKSYCWVHSPRCCLKSSVPVPRKETDPGITQITSGVKDPNTYTYAFSPPLFCIGFGPVDACEACVGSCSRNSNRCTSKSRTTFHFDEVPPVPGCRHFKHHSHQITGRRHSLSTGFSVHTDLQPHFLLICGGFSYK